MRLIGRTLPILLAVSAPAWGQFYFFEAESFQSIEQPPKKPIIADVTSTLTAPTPWGPFTQTETGKYWRSRNGKLRQDDSYGLSTLIDLGSPSRSLAYIDYELRRIWQSVRPPRRIPKNSSIPSAGDQLGNEFHFGPSTKPRRIGQSVVEGFKVSIRTGELLYTPPPLSHVVDPGDPAKHLRKPESTGVTYEIWTSDELKMILLMKVRSGDMEFVQRYHNIRREEPDPSVFKLPTGFRIVRLFPTVLKPGEACLSQETGITGAPESFEVTRPCSHR